ncbi:MAG: glycine zipper family protein [Pseudomonadota bacterium]
MTLLSVALVAVLTGCASTPGKPIVDMKGVNAYQYEQDLEECSVYADEVEVGAKAVGGAATGAAVGAAIGAIWDGYRGNSPERGAATGAVIGGAGGVGSGVTERSQVVKNCLRGRGYRVLN